MAKTKIRKSSRKSTTASISRDVRGVIADAEELLQATAGELGEKAREIRKELVRKIEAAKEKFQNLDDVKEAAEEGLKEVDQVIRKHPYESVGAALVAGLIIGALLNRR
ncbi:MAG: DUF883 domain-containing protein [Verrucomicrobia bacterium]|nr:DUF883 domain-containing protein [Verrucomicrobiota bacterium]NDD81897.1 DUF883 domain-containing protein [Verrucomicrobiota bacterium]